jgi:RND family efflux transporter MFP subunit
MIRHLTTHTTHTARGFAMSGHMRKGWAMLGLVAASLIAGCAADEENTAEAAPSEERAIQLSSADVATAETKTLSGGVVLTGSLQPANAAQVKAQVPGTVTRLLVDRGTAVQQGQPIAEIEAAGVRANAAAAEANLALARQRLESARTLREAGAMSAIDFQAAQAGYEAAVAQAEGAKEMAQRATVRAPITGVVAERIIGEGEAVGMNDHLLTIVRSDVLELAGSVPVDAASQIRPGQAVVFELSAFPGREFRGEVARIEPVADPQTRQVGVYLRMRNPGGVIGGQFARGRVTRSDHRRGGRRAGDRGARQRRRHVRAGGGGRPRGEAHGRAGRGRRGAGRGRDRVRPRVGHAGHHHAFRDDRGGRARRGGRSRRSGPRRHGGVACKSTKRTPDRG